MQLCALIYERTWEEGCELEGKIWFIEYNFLFRRQGILQLAYKKQNITLEQGTSDRKLLKQRYELQSDISTSHHELGNRSIGFFTYARMVPDTLRLLESGFWNEY